MATEKEKYISEAKMAEKPVIPARIILKDRIVKTKHLDDACITPDKLDESVGKLWLNPALDKMFKERIRPLMERLEKSDMSLDEKYTNITNELYSMVASLQVGGIAISQQFGDRTDIGISQKILTKILGRLWDELGQITHKTYMDFTLTVTPTSIISEEGGSVTVKADCSDAISDFDNIKVYRDDELVAESSDIEVFYADVPISQTSVIKVVGTIMGKAITKQQSVTKLYPFFMGGGMNYTDVLVPACQKELHGTLEGEYDATISASGQYLFVIIPISRKEEFRRCKMDMNGFEIPFDVTETSDLIICKSQNTYVQGDYNLDIDINS